MRSRKSAVQHAAEMGTDVTLFLEPVISLDIIKSSDTHKHRHKCLVMHVPLCVVSQ